MNIAILCGSYLPNPSAVGVCAHNIVTALEKQGHTVSIIIPFDHNDDFKNVYKFTTKDLSRFYSNNNIIRFIVRVKSYVKAIFSKLNIRKSYIQGFCDILTKIDCKHPIDLIIPFCFPFESILGAIAFKKNCNREVEIKPVIFDNFVDNPNLHRLKINLKIKRNRHLKLLCDAIEYVNHSYISHSQRPFIQRQLPHLLTKITFIEHPLLIKQPPIVNNNNTVVYTGAFLKNYVRSAELASILAVIVPQISNNIEFCIMGNDLKPIEDLAKRFPKRVFNHGTVPFEIAQNFMRKAGILLSVAEFSGIQISSKIFSYISLGKPIIQLYYNPNDINVRILRKYPNSLCINVSDKKNFEDNVKKIGRFIKDKCGQHLSFDEVKKLYPEAIPEYLIKQIMDIE